VQLFKKGDPVPLEKNITMFTLHENFLTQTIKANPCIFLLSIFSKKQCCLPFIQENEISKKKPMK
jgi:hypothetical protein